MIKMIASDMDGTLLDSSKVLDSSFFDIYQDIKKRGILFVVASGNQFDHLYQQFLPVSDELYFIAENGNYITKGKEELYSSHIHQEIVKQVMSMMSQYPRLMSVMCGKKQAYIGKEYQCYEAKIKQHYASYCFIESLDDMDDEVLKISIHDPNYHIERYVSDIALQLPEGLKLLTSGNEWMDIQQENIHKGTGIHFLMKYCGIHRDECVAFGDQMNDYEMLKSVKYSYAMSNAVDAIKDIAFEVIGSHEEKSVLKKLKEIVEEERC